MLSCKHVFFSIIVQIKYCKIFIIDRQLILINLNVKESVCSTRMLNKLTMDRRNAAANRLSRQIATVWRIN